MWWSWLPASSTSKECQKKVLNIPHHAEVCTRHNFSQLLMSRDFVSIYRSHWFPRNTSLPIPGLRCHGVGQKLPDLHVRAESQVEVLCLTELGVVRAVNIRNSKRWTHLTFIWLYLFIPPDLDYASGMHTCFPKIDQRNVFFQGWRRRWFNIKQSLWSLWSNK